MYILYMVRDVGRLRVDGNSHRSSLVDDDLPMHKWAGTPSGRNHKQAQTQPWIASRLIDAFKPFQHGHGHVPSQKFMFFSLYPRIL